MGTFLQSPALSDNRFGCKYFLATLPGISCPSVAENQCLDVRGSEIDPGRSEHLGHFSASVVMVTDDRSEVQMGQAEHQKLLSRQLGLKSCIKKPYDS